MSKLTTLVQKFADSGWDTIDKPAQQWIVATQSLVAALKQADIECGSCGCKFDPLYKEVLALICNS